MTPDATSRPTDPHPVSGCGAPKLEIVNYLHCKLCLAEMPQDMPPKDYQSIEVGLIGEGCGLQVWCKRHDCNIMTVRLNGDNWTWDDRLNLGVVRTELTRQVL